jgi:PhnB protein
MKAPAYYNALMPYMIVSKAHDFANFLKAVFNAEEQLIVPRQAGGIMHAEFTIGEACIMFCDATEDYLPFACSMFILVNDVTSVYQKALVHGAASLQDIAERDYGKSAGIKDTFGNVWWLTEMPKQ